MTAPRRGFEVPHGAIANEDGMPTQAMIEYMDTITKALAILKTAADAMDDLEPTTVTNEELGDAWEEFRALLQGIE